MKIRMSWCNKNTASRSANFETYEFDFEKMHLLTEQWNYSHIEWEGGIRKAENFIAAHALILDFDGYGLTLEEAKREFNDQKNLCIVTSKSHQCDNKVNDDGSLGKSIEAADHFHVIIGLPSPITDLALYKQVTTTLIEKYNSDASCKDGARFFFGNPNQEYWYSSQHTELPLIKGNAELSIIEGEFECL